MTLVQQSSSNHWFEDAPDSDTLTIPGFFQKDGSGDWILATTGQADGVAVDYNGDGSYSLVDISAAGLYEITATGSDYAIAIAGTRVAVLAADSSDVGLTTDLTQIPIAVLGTEVGSGDVVMVRNASPTLELLAVSGSYIGHEDN
jgi:hypothetical protein